MDTNETLERMYNQKLYFCDNEDLMKEQPIWLDKIFEYNNLKPSQRDKKTQMLKEMFADFGDGCYIESPFHANWGGKHVHFGCNVYANFNLVLVDDCDIYVGDYTMIGPNVVLCAGTHPINPTLRIKQAQYNLPIHIEENVWIGANCVVLPGVTIGKNSVIGAGSIVTKDIPSNVVALGSPCKVIRKINQRDMEYYYKDFKIDI